MVFLSHSFHWFLYGGITDNDFIIISHDCSLGVENTINACHFFRHIYVNERSFQVGVTYSNLQKKC